MDASEKQSTKRKSMEQEENEDFLTTIPDPSYNFKEFSVIEPTKKTEGFSVILNTTDGIYS